MLKMGFLLLNVVLFSLFCLFMGYGIAEFLTGIDPFYG